MGFNYSRTLTIDHTKCGSSSSSNFPVLVSATDSTLKSVANGGHVTDSGGADILFFSDSAATTQLPSEIDFYDPINGVLVAWVQLTTVSNTVDTLFYLFYGNSSAPARTANPWDANYKAVYHMSNGTVLTTTDSTTNSNNSSSNTGTATVGKIDGGVNYTGTNLTVTTVPTSTSLNFSGAFTLEAWVFPTVSNVFQILVSRTSASNIRQYSMYLSSSGTGFVFVGAGGVAGTNYAVNPTWTVNAWNHIVVSADGSNKIIYINGVQANSSSGNASASIATANTYLGLDGQFNGLGLNGKLDEARISNTNRSADWILTSFNNQNTPGNIGSSNFLTWGSETVVSSGANIINLMGIKIGMSIS